MPGLALERHAHGHDAAMREHRLARVGSATMASVKPWSRGEERGDAARIVGFLVGAEQEGRIARACACRGREQAGRRALDVAGAQADRAVVGHAQLQRIGGSRPASSGTVSRCTLNTRVGVATHREQGHRAGAVVDDVDSGNPAAARAGNRRCRPCRSRAADCGCRTPTSASRCSRTLSSISVSLESVVVRPVDFGPERAAHAEQRMKPSASATPQSADCA